MSILYGVGIGPGDPELMTLKAKKTIEACDVIGIPAKEKESCVAFQITKEVLPDITDKEILYAPIPMTVDKEALDMAYGEIANKIAACLAEGKNVAFLNLGDPTLYSTYMPVHEKVRSMGYEAEIISGVCSVVAMTALLNENLAKRNHAVHILPGLYKGKEAQFEKELLTYLFEGDNVVIMKPGSAFDQIVSILKDMEKIKLCKAYVVNDIGMEREKVFDDIQNLPDSLGYFTTIFVKSLRKKMK